MAVIAEGGTLKTVMTVRFPALDRAEAAAIGNDLREVILQRMEYHGFHPEGVTVFWETR